MSRETEAVRELLGLAGVSPPLRASLDVALQWHEAQERPHGTPGRMVEGVDPAAREQALRRRYPNDPDRFVAAWRAGER